MTRLTSVGRILLLAALVSLALSGCIFQLNGYTIDCTGFAVEIAYVQPTVDNTGSGNELIGVGAVDGAGRSLLNGPVPMLPLPLGMSYPPAGDPFWTMFAGLPPIPWDNAPLYNPITVTFYNPAGGVLAHAVELLRLTGVCPGLPYLEGAGIDDGRLNRFDVAAPVAVFPVEYATGTGLHLYAIMADGVGTLVLEVTPEMIAAVPAMPAENTLIAATPDGSIALYRLTTGEFQLNAGEYVIVFSDLTSTADYYIP